MRAEAQHQHRGIWELMLAAGLALAASTAKWFGKTLGVGGTLVESEESTIEAEAPEPPPRLKDLRSRPLSDENSTARVRIGTFLAASSFVMSLAAGIGFLFVYWTGGSDMLLGLTLALFFAGTGCGLVISARWLMRQEQAHEQLEPLPSPPREVQEFTEDWQVSEVQAGRRGLLEWMAAAVVALLAAMFVSLLRSFTGAPGPELIKKVWTKGQRLVTASGGIVSVNTLNPGDTVTVFPENSVGAVDAQTVLIRIAEGSFRLSPERAGWTPMGYAAYSRVCTHAGCPVGLFEAHTNILLCPCHQSTFNVLNGAQPTSGPAARALPQLPLYIDADGTLRAGGDFSQPPGPGFWTMPRVSDWESKTE